MKIITKCGVTLIDSMGDDLRVANAARVSFAKWKDTFDKKDERLLEYLSSHHHWTPFAHVIATLRFDAPIFTARQWFKHQVGVTRNEVSRRYVDDDPAFFIPEHFHTRPTDGVKQGSGGTHPENEKMQLLARDRAARALSEYRHDIAMGIAPEEARMSLPQNAVTSWIETGSLAYYARACTLRVAPDAQRAVRQLGRAVLDAVKDIAPKAWADQMEQKL